jgi:hypothetical protein
MGECLLRLPSTVLAEGQGTGSYFSPASASEPVTISTPSLDSDRSVTFHLIAGQAIKGVTSITLVLSDGTPVKAISGNGFFLAWWQGNLSVTSYSFVQSGSVHQVPYDSNLLPKP